MLKEVQGLSQDGVSFRRGMSSLIVSKLKSPMLSFFIKCCKKCLCGYVVRFNRDAITCCFLILWPSLLFSQSTISPGGPMRIDFSNPEECKHWIAIHDTVMGGQSAGNMVFKDGFSVFSGRLSLENNGGFSSVRRSVDIAKDFEEIQLRIMGDGRLYQLRIRTNQSMDGVSYAASFQTNSGEWQVFSFKETDFEPTFRGRRVPDAPDLDFKEIKQIGFLIADKTPGPFKIKLSWISTLEKHPN